MHAAAGVRDAEQLERALHRAVLAEAAVQRDEHAVEALAISASRPRSRGSNGVRVHAALRAAPRAPSLPLISEISRSAERPPSSTATLPKLAPALIMSRSPMMRTSRLELDAELLRAPPLRTCSISASMSAGAARRRGLTMKFACFSEIRAPPIAWPLSPQASISRAAWSPGGLRNTEPAFGWLSGWVAMRRASSSLIRARDAAPSPRGEARTTPRDEPLVGRRCRPPRLQRARGGSRSS